MFTVISNPSQRKGVGGRPALVINTKDYYVRNLTNSLIEIPWGVEATWALLTPKNVNNASKIQKIAVCSLYSKPNSKMKTRLLDHISLAYSIISSKFTTGLHFILAGDTNELKLDSILHLNSRMKQMVVGMTRMDPPRMLDPILTTLGCYYQVPEILAPLGADLGTNGKASDHMIVVMRPINSIDNICARSYTKIKVRPIHKSGMQLLRNWFESQVWTSNLGTESIDQKAELLLSQVLEAVNNFLPEKVIKVASDDQPWFTEPLKRLDRRRRREYRRNRISDKYRRLNCIYQDRLSKAKKSYKRNMIDDIKSAKPGEWYSKLKRITRYDQQKSEVIQVEEICHLDDQEQAERIADNQARISNTYKEVKISDISIPPFEDKDIPQFSTHQVREYILRLKSSKSTPPGDIPVKIVKEFASQLCVPLTDIINCSLKQGHWATCFKKEVITPIPKEYPVLTIDKLRPISSLLAFNKVQEMALCEMIASDMAAKLDPTQYGNRKRTGIQHYLIRMLHRILAETDNSRGEINAVLCTFIDWKEAYSRQSHILGLFWQTACGQVLSLS